VVQWSHGQSGFSVGGVVVLYGYRTDEVMVDLMSQPDPTFRLRFFKQSELKRRPYRISLGCHFDGAALPVPDGSYFPSQIEGCLKRVASAMPLPDNARRRRLKRFVVRFLNKEFAGCQFSEEETFDFNEWLDATPYPAYRKDELRKIYDDQADIAQAKNVKGFTKDEHYSEYKAYRGIHSRSDHFKVLIGPFFAKFSKKIFASRFFIKKIAVCDRPRFILERMGHYTKIFMTDYSKFEATFKLWLMKIEFLVYDWFLKYHPKRAYFMHLFKSVLAGVNYVSFKNWCFKLTACRMSGEMNTSEGNGIMNLILTFFLLIELGNDPDGVFEGDDGMSCISHNFPTVADYATLGAVIKIDVPAHWSEGSFCGMIFDPEVGDNVTDPMECIMSFGYTTREYTGANIKTKLSLLRSKSMSLLYQYPGCPMLRNLALYGLRMTKDLDPKRYQRFVSSRKIDTYERQLYDEVRAYWDSHEVVGKAIDDRTRDLVWRRFNIDPCLQKDFEAYLDNKDDLSPIIFPRLLQFCNSDQIHYYDHYSVAISDMQKLPDFCCDKVRRINTWRRLGIPIQF